MVKATFTTDDGRYTLSVKGHANYAEYGKDIVCAGVSSLVQALIGWLEENYDRADNVSIDTHGGGLSISAEGDEDIKAVFQLVVVGLEQIADRYPNNVQIDIIGVAD